MTVDEKMNWFVNARYGMFVHYGLYSLLERGEWVMNRERHSVADVKALAEEFTADRFDANEICDLALAGGMRYINLTTMHHDGFRLYDTELSDFNTKRACGRDLVEEIVNAARERGLRIELYHSLNNWSDQPDGVAALESRDAYEEFVANTHARIKELMTRFNPVDVMWYDGWWPFHADGWQAQEMNDMVRAIQPNIIFNGRNGLDGDFGTPEGHMSAPSPWRPWEGCMTLNDNWGYHRGDHHWKSPDAVIRLLATAARAKGNLLLNIGPRGDGSIPEPSVQIIREVGQWLKTYGECVYDTDMFTYDLMERGDHKGDWNHNGPFTLKGRSLYQLVMNWTGSELIIGGLNTTVNRVELLNVGECAFTQDANRVVITGLPERAPSEICSVVRLDCQDVPEMYLTGGMRVPTVAHPPYDPCASDIQH